MIDAANDWLVERVVGLLEHQVLPAVEDRSARTALQLVVGLLDNLAPRLGAAADLASREDGLRRRLCRDLPPDLARRTVLDPEQGGGGPDEVSRARVSRALRLVRDDPEALSEPSTQAWLSACRQELARTSALEMTLMRSTRYYISMSS
ncbi:hypothetical protein [Saccharopolyspora sp. ASAGF58]|uniref:hypothetical protein n=1 Tax=Saccharopolyspora sp. ASAGF58 TaxID=2719023 RepID=UPI0014402E7B|nr:hypothetical protein [Saccharopolyspora sp. ASAGF58]QIZ37988.1 hypothetical protein FDZ84_29740 [Saccharopolyspora sp. ASAGF58]